MKIKQLGEIYQGYKNLIFENKEIEKIAIPRLKICEECPIRTGMICDKSKGGCGCNTAAKVRCLTCKCPKNKW